MAKKVTSKKSASKKSARSKSAGASRGGTTLKKQLEDMSGLWNDAEARTGGFVPLPDGTYQMRIEGATIESSKTSQRLQVNWQMQVITPEEFAGKTARKYDGLNTQENIEWVKGSLETLDIEIPDTIDELPEALQKTKGMIVECTLQTRNDIQNLYFNELVEGGDDEDDADADDADEDVDEDVDEEEEEEEEEVELEEGQNVEAVYADGETYPGVITEVGQDSSTVKFEDDEEVDTPNEDITVLS